MLQSLARRLPAWLLILGALCCSMEDMETLALRNAMLVHSLDWNERRAGIFEPAPADDAAVATTLGLVLNCLSSGLYMVSNLSALLKPPNPVKACLKTCAYVPCLCTLMLVSSQAFFLHANV